MKLTPFEVRLILKALVGSLTVQEVKDLKVIKTMLENHVKSATA